MGKRLNKRAEPHEPFVAIDADRGAKGFPTNKRVASLDNRIVPTIAAVNKPFGMLAKHWPPGRR